MRLPVFEDITLVAGHSGIDREVTWAHVVDVPDALQWVRKGDLLLATGVAWSNDPQWQVELITSLHAKGISGLLLATGRYFDAVPSVVKAMADRLRLPVFDSPFRVPFVEIIESVGRTIAQEQAQMLEQSEAIHRALTAAALHADTLTDLLQVLARLIGKRVVIQNTQQQMLASASPSTNDDERSKSPLADEETAEPLRLSQMKLPHQWKRVTQAITVPADSNSGGEACIVCPIRVGEELHGLLWVIGEGEPLSDLDVRAAEHGATVAALHLMRHQAASRVNRTIQSTFLDMLLAGDKHTSQLLEQAQVLDFELDKQYMTGMAILLRKGRSAQFWPLQTVEDYHRRERVGQTIAQWLEQRGHRPLITNLMNQVWFPVPVESPEQARGAIDSLSKFLSPSERNNLLLSFGSVGHGAHGIRESYREGRITACLFAPAPRVVWYEDLKLAQLLSSIPRDELESWVARSLQPIMTSNAPQQYMETLEALVECGFNQNRAAEALYIHKNTLRYRLRKIEEVLGRTINDIGLQHEIMMAFTAHKLLSADDM